MCISRRIVSRRGGSREQCAKGERSQLYAALYLPPVYDMLTRLPCTSSNGEKEGLLRTEVEAHVWSATYRSIERTVPNRSPGFGPAGRQSSVTLLPRLLL